MSTSPNREPTTSEQREVRIGKRERLITEIGEAYPVDVNPTHSLSEARNLGNGLEADEKSGTVVSVVGRLVSSRNGGKLCFAVIQSGDGTRIQLMLSLAVVGEQSILSWRELTDLGDHVQATGEVVASRTGELRHEKRIMS